MFHIKQREKEKEKLWKTETWNCNSLWFWLCHFARRCTSSNMLNICLQPIENYSRHYSPHLLFMDNNVTYRNKSINSRNNNVIWCHVCNNIKNTDDSEVTGLVTWPDVIPGANPVLFSLRLAPEWMKFSIYSGQKMPVWRAPLQLISDVRGYVYSLQPFSNKVRSNPVQ